ncbi:recombinase family protein [Brevibacillus sp. SYSU BS000544]|uniref:recombinase family protein n=1 Tax=Brevibacillus sp. SYSU BS000544 TaxID=3416443 RepID=UPI003CE4E4A3
MLNKTKAAIYTRVSTERQAEEGYSLEAQHDILMDVLERKGLDLYRVYSDPGVSGGSFKRPGVQQMITDLKAGRFEAVLIHKLDRLSRNLGDLYTFIDLINKLNVRLIIAAQGSEEIDTRSPMGKAFLFFSGIWAQIYLENLREETLKGLTKRAQSGERHMSRPALGYSFDNDEKKNLILNEDEAKLIREVYKQYIDGKGLNSIAQYMNSFSRGKEGGIWDSKYIRIILTNYTYLGKNHFKPKHWGEEKRIITEGDHPPIITEKEFNTVQEIMKRRRDGYMSTHSYEYAYSGIIRCGKCGTTYVGYGSVHRGKMYRSYRCRNNYTHKICDATSISENKLTALIFEKLQLQSDGIQEKKSQKLVSKKSLQKEIDISNRRKKNWMMALGDGKLSANDYSMLVEEEEERINRLFLEYQEESFDGQLSSEELLQMMLNLKQNWEYLEPETQKSIVQSMFKEITIEKIPTDHKDKWVIKKCKTV